MPMKNRGTLMDDQLANDLYEMTKETSLIKMSENRHNEIIQAMYGKINIVEHVKGLKHLSQNEQKLLTQVLEAYPDMYQGAIGTLNIEPVHFELKPNAIPYHARPFPVPRAYENLTKQEARHFEKDNMWSPHTK